MLTQYDVRHFSTKNECLFRSITSEPLKYFYATIPPKHECISIAVLMVKGNTITLWHPGVEINKLTYGLSTKKPLTSKPGENGTCETHQFPSENAFCYMSTACNPTINLHFVGRTSRVSTPSNYFSLQNIVRDN